MTEAFICNRFALLTMNQGALTELWLGNDIEWRPEMSSTDVRMQFLRELAQYDQDNIGKPPKNRVK